MPETTPVELRRLALMDCFAKASWIALGTALACLSFDAYTIFGISHHVSASGATLVQITIRVVQGALALLAFWLIRFAMLQPPHLRKQA